MKNRLELRLRVREGRHDPESLVFEIKVDGKLVADFDYYATDLQECR